MDTTVPLGAVMVGLDGSPESARALGWAAAEARRRHVPLHLMHAIDERSSALAARVHARPGMHPVIREALSVLGDLGRTTPVTWSQPVGDAAPVLASGARNARLVAVGSHGRGALGDLAMGSVTTHLISLTRCPVAVLRSDTPVAAGDAPVVAGVQYGTPCAPVLDAAFEQAGSRHVDLVVVHAWQLDSSTVVDGVALQGVAPQEAQRRESDLLDRTVAGAARGHAAVRVTTHAVQDGVREALARCSAGAALLVIGARGLGEFGGAVLGSTSQQMIRSAACPVLVVRAGWHDLAAVAAATARRTSP